MGKFKHMAVKFVLHDLFHVKYYKNVKQDHILLNMRWIVLGKLIAILMPVFIFVKLA